MSKNKFLKRVGQIYIFLSKANKTICLICIESVTVNKECNLKWHHKTNQNLQMNGTIGKYSMKKFLKNFAKLISLISIKL